MNLKNKVVIVTGASSGIGYATAKAFALRKAIPVVFARRQHLLEELEKELKSIQPKSFAFCGDVTQEKVVIEFVNLVISKFGKIDILVNNAGILKLGKMLDSENYIEECRDMMETNFLGMVRFAKTVVPQMKKQRYGVVINMSSVLAFKPFNCLGGFGASVAALTAFNDSLRQELEPHNIRVAIIHPGLTQTPVLQNYELPKQFKRFTPLTPEYVAKKILHIASRKRFRVILPFHAHYLLVGSTISVKLGDFMVKMLQNRFFTRVIGIYRGKTYESK